MDAHQHIVEEDAGGVAAGRPQDVSPLAVKSDVADLIESLEESFRDMRECAMKKLRAYRSNVKWTLPGGVKARVAPHMVARVYRSGRTFEDYVRDMMRRKELRGNHLAEEMLSMALLVDRAVMESNDDWINHKSTEIALRRLYGLERAFGPVRSVADWKPSKNAGGKWRSKVQFHLMDEIDVGTMDPDNIGIEAVDKEVRERLKDKALLAKSLGNLGSVPAGSAEEH